jgi:hypothetical protein
VHRSARSHRGFATILADPQQFINKAGKVARAPAITLQGR